MQNGGQKSTPVNYPEINSKATVNSNFAIFKIIYETMAGGNWFNGYKQVK